MWYVVTFRVSYYQVETQLVWLKEKAYIVDLLPHLGFDACTMHLAREE